MPGAGSGTEALLGPGRLAPSSHTQRTHGPRPTGSREAKRMAPLHGCHRHCHRHGARAGVVPPHRRRRAIDALRRGARQRHGLPASLPGVVSANYWERAWDWDRKTTCAVRGTAACMRHGGRSHPSTRRCALVLSLWFSGSPAQRPIPPTHPLALSVCGAASIASLLLPDVCACLLSASDAFATRSAQDQSSVGRTRTTNTVASLPQCRHALLPRRTAHTEQLRPCSLQGA